MIRSVIEFDHYSALVATPRSDEVATNGCVGGGGVVRVPPSCVPTTMRGAEVDERDPAAAATSLAALLFTNSELCREFHYSHVNAESGGLGIPVRATRDVVTRLVCLTSVCTNVYSRQRTTSKACALMVPHFGVLLRACLRSRNWLAWFHHACTSTRQHSLSPTMTARPRPSMLRILRSWMVRGTTCGLLHGHASLWPLTS